MGCESEYEVSEKGVRSLSRTLRHGNKMVGRELKPHFTPGGYRTFVLSVDGKRMVRSHHSLVAEAFIGPRPDGMMVLHRDDVKLNCSVSNLYYGTSTQNSSDAVRNGRNSNTKKTHCPKGHLLRGDNLVASSLSLGQRKCRSCVHARNYLRYRTGDFQAISDAYFKELEVGHGAE